MTSILKTNEEIESEIEQLRLQRQDLIKKIAIAEEKCVKYAVIDTSELKSIQHDMQVYETTIGWNPIKFTKERVEFCYDNEIYLKLDCTEDVFYVDGVQVPRADISRFFEEAEDKWTRVKIEGELDLLKRCEGC